MEHPPTPRRRHGLVAAAAATSLLIASCGGDDSAQPTNEPDAGSDVESTPPADADPGATPVAPTSDADPPSTSTSDPAADPSEFREFVVDGVAVQSRSALDQLPSQATEIEFGGTLIDEGAGPMMCLGGVLDSYPPQCAGPVVEGLELGDWAETANDVTFGERTVRVTWPPADGRVTLIADRGFEPPTQPARPTLELPADCEDIDVFVGREQLGSYRQAHPESTAAMYTPDGGRTHVLMVSGDLEAVRADLTNGDAEPCLDHAEYSRAELEAAQDAITDTMGEAPLYVMSAGSGNAYNRVTVDVAAADTDTVARLAALVDDPAMLLVFGTTTILAGD